jgi:hypothetical protein
LFEPEEDVTVSGMFEPERKVDIEKKWGGGGEGKEEVWRMTVK